MSSPTPQHPRLKVEEVGDVVVVTLLDRRILHEQNIKIIGDQLAALVDDQNCRKLLLNFSSVEYLSSATLGRLISLHKKLREIGGKLILCGITPAIFEVFAITRLDKVFTMQKDVETALDTF